MFNYLSVSRSVRQRHPYWIHPGVSQLLQSSFSVLLRLTSLTINSIVPIHLQFYNIYKVTFIRVGCIVGLAEGFTLDMLVFLLGKVRESLREWWWIENLLLNSIDTSRGGAEQADVSYLLSTYLHRANMECCRFQIDLSCRVFQTGTYDFV